MGLSTTNSFQEATAERWDSQPEQRALLSWFFPGILLENPTAAFCHPNQLCEKQSCLPTKAQRSPHHQGSSFLWMRHFLECVALELQVHSYLVSYEKQNLSSHLSRMRLLMCYIVRKLRQGSKEVFRHNEGLVSGKSYRQVTISTEDRTRGMRFTLWQQGLRHPGKKFSKHHRVLGKSFQLTIFLLAWIHPTLQQIVVYRKPCLNFVDFTIISRPHFTEKNIKIKWVLLNMEY